MVVKKATYICGTNEKITICKIIKIDDFKSSTVKLKCFKNILFRCQVIAVESFFK